MLKPNLGFHQSSSWSNGFLSASGCWNIRIQHITWIDKICYILLALCLHWVKIKSHFTNQKLDWILHDTNCYWSCSFISPTCTEWKWKGINMFKLQACSDVFVPALKLLEGFHEDNLKAPVLHISLCLHQKDATIKQLT